MQLVSSPHTSGPLPPPTRVATYSKQAGGSHNPGSSRGGSSPTWGDVGKDQPRHEKAIPMGPCRAYTVKYIDNMLLPNKRKYVLKGDGLHLTRTGAGILTEKYSKIVCPFPDPLKGSVGKQECQDPVLVRPRHNPSVATPVTQLQQNSGHTCQVYRFWR